MSIAFLVVMLLIAVVAVMMVSDGLPADTLKSCLLTPMPSVEEALEAALARHGRNAVVTVIPEGPYVTPYVTPKPAAAARA